MEKNIKIYLEEDNSINRYVISIFSSFSKIPITYSSIEESDLAFVSHLDKVSVSHNCLLVYSSLASSVNWNAITPNQTLESSSDDFCLRLNFLKAVELLTTDEVNSNTSDEAYDKHDRLKYEMSFQKINGFDAYPLVNRYFNILIKLLSDKFELKRGDLYPGGKKCAIILSHDVDYPQKYASVYNYPWLPRGPIPEFLKLNVERLKSTILLLLDKNRSDYWLFDDIMKLESSFGFKSSFYFSSINRFMKWGSKNDVVYDIRQSRFKELFLSIQEAGFEVGLHPSYYAYKSLTNLTTEKELLENCINKDVVGMRHHLWHMGKEVSRTLRMHNDAGFKYDSSIAFNNNIGFRRSIAIPYHPWDEIGNAPLDILQIPMMAMDGNFFYKESNVYRAVDELLKYKNILKIEGGVGAVDWHVRTSYPRNKEYFLWGTAYKEFLEELSLDKEVWVTNGEEFYNWFKSNELK
ncbi:MAG: hypothetical protein ACI9QN_000297 [Arcticibacterium sp.]|jgi:hypothetical protein